MPPPPAAAGSRTSLCAHGWKTTKSRDSRVNRHRFPGVDVHARLTRHYPLGALGVHVLGYVGRISESELDRIDPVNYRGTIFIGKIGAEQAYEDWLHGKVGYQHVETNARGRILRVLERQDPVPGRNLFLTIDVKLQRVAEAALGNENGAVVALDPATGAVLAMASMPGFDPNPFAGGIEASAYRALLRSPGRPLFKPRGQRPVSAGLHDQAVRGARRA